MPSSSRFSSSVLTQLETSIHGVIKDSLGFSDPNLLQAALNTIQEGGEEKDIKSEPAGILYPLLYAGKLLIVTLVPVEENIVFNSHQLGNEIKKIKT